MKIKLSLFLNILLCFTIQESFCEAQDIQVLQDTDEIIVINDSNKVLTDQEIQDKLSNTQVLSESDDLGVQILNNEIQNNNSANHVPLEGIIKEKETNSTEIDNNESDLSLYTDNKTPDIVSNDISKTVPENEELNNDVLPKVPVDSVNLENEAVISNTIKSDNISSTNNTKIAKNNLEDTNTTDTINKDNKNITKNNIMNDTQSSNNTNTNNNKPIEPIKTLAKKPTRIYVSLMFTEDNINKIFSSLPASSIGIPDQYMNSPFTSITPTQNNGITPIQEEVKVFNLYAFLNSIMYISDDIWSVWVNGNKMTNLRTVNGDLSIVKVSPLYVDFIWKFTPLQWQAINRNNSIPNNMYKETDGIVELYFTLSPNQTYYPAKNKILEGMPEKTEEQTEILEEETIEEIPANSMTENLFF